MTTERKTLQKGSTGADVLYLQTTLTQKGYAISIDGIFGKQTHEAVCQFQQSAHLTADGIAGPKTWAALTTETPPTIDPSLFEKAAQTLNVEVAAIRAVHQVEAGGQSGFLPDGRTLAIFEGHIFWNELKKSGIDPEKYRIGNEDIVFPQWNRASYTGGADEYNRLNRACVIHHGAALRSAAWGLFQIMGFNHTLCGYDSVYVYAASMQMNQDYQFDAFIRFIQNTKLDIPLRKLRWTDFAWQYNGRRYKENRYVERLEVAYSQAKKKKI